jgi:hypothetical protein
MRGEDRRDNRASRRLALPIRSRCDFMDELRAVLDDIVRETPEKTMSIAELSAYVQSLGMPTGDEATQMIREDRDSR